MIKIIPARASDVTDIAHLLEELDRFYGATEVEPPGERISGIADALFGAPQAALVLLAWDGAALAGLASYSFLWPAAGVTRSLYLKELYVRRDYRRQGIGKLLMVELQAIAAAHGCSRMEWTTETDNEVAHGFYEALGAARLNSKIVYRVPG